MGPAPPRRNIFASPERAARPVLKTDDVSEPDRSGERVEMLQPADDEPMQFDDGPEDSMDIVQPAEETPALLEEDNTAEGVSEVMAAEIEDVHVEVVLPSAERRKPGRPRKSLETANARQIIDTPSAASTSAPKRKPGRPSKSVESANTSHITISPSAASITPGKKRDRASMESEQAEDERSTLQERLDAVSASRSQKKRRGKPSRDKVIVHREEEEEVIDPQLLAYGDEYIEEESREPSVQPEKKAKSKKSKAAPPKERDPNRAIRAATSPVKLHDGPANRSMSPSKPRNSRGMSLGPVSNVNLRATTPFDDAAFVSRSGRPVIKPLQYWANETRVWKNGEIEGIVRAEEITKPQHGNKGRKKKKPKKGGKGISRLEDIDEESETESTLADEWEEEMGVIAGTVANWDPATQIGDPNDTIREGMLLLTSLHLPRYHILTSAYRSRVRGLLDHHSRRCRLRFQVRKNHDPALLRRWCRGAPTRGLQAREEQPQNAHGVLRPRRQSHGRNRRARQRRGESVRHLEGWCLGRA